ncbi:MAG TPA: GNAT family N-acetyltransferase [Chloroflexota bacterium]|nr:GNAT family N-acetyltransferase [Chloroflexota bacterium]
MQTADHLKTRQATVEDIPILVRHRRLMFESMGFCDAAINDEMSAIVADQLTRWIPSGEYRGWIVETPERRIVAGIGLSIIQLPGSPRNVRGRYSYLMSLYVEPEYRRIGIAGRLVEEMIQWSRSQGLTEVRLHASDQGRPLYEKLGFVQTNEMRLLLSNRQTSRG